MDFFAEFAEYKNKKGAALQQAPLCMSGKRDLNPRRQPWQGCTLPLSYSRITINLW